MFLQITVSAVFALLFVFQTSLVIAEVPKTLLLQNALRAAGYHPGPSDGFFGDRTARALSNALGMVGTEQSPKSVEDLTAGIFDSLTDVFNLHYETLDLQQARLQKIISPEDARRLISRVGLGAHPKEMQALAGLTRSAAISKVVTKLVVHNTQLPLPVFFSNTYPTHCARNDLDEGEQQTFRMERDKEMAQLWLW